MFCFRIFTLKILLWLFSIFQLQCIEIASKESSKVKLKHSNINSSNKATHQMTLKEKKSHVESKEMDSGTLAGEIIDDDNVFNDDENTFLEDSQDKNDNAQLDDFGEPMSNENIDDGEQSPSDKDNGEKHDDVKTTPDVDLFKETKNLHDIKKLLKTNDNLENLKLNKNIHRSNIHLMDDFKNNNEVKINYQKNNDDVQTSDIENNNLKNTNLKNTINEDEDVENNNKIKNEEDKNNAMKNNENYNTENDEIEMNKILRSKMKSSKDDESKSVKKMLHSIANLNRQFSDMRFRVEWLDSRYKKLGNEKQIKSEIPTAPQNYINNTVLELISSNIMSSINQNLVPKLFKVTNDVVNQQTDQIRNKLTEFNEWWEIKKLEMGSMEQNMNQLMSREKEDLDRLNKIITERGKQTSITTALPPSSTASPIINTTVAPTSPIIMTTTIGTTKAPLAMNNSINHSVEDYCPENNDYGMTWKSTLRGETLQVACPEGVLGNLTRICNEEVKWERPNFINCYSPFIATINDKIHKSDLTVLSTKYILHLTKDLSASLISTLQRRMIYSGEIKFVLLFLDDVSHFLIQNSKDFDIEFLNILFEICDSLLDPINSNEWISVYNTLQSSELDVIKMINSIVKITQNSYYKIDSCVTHHFRSVDYQINCDILDLLNVTHGNFITDTKKDENSMFVEIRNLIINQKPQIIKQRNQSLYSPPIFGKFVHRNQSLANDSDSNLFTIQSMVNEDKTSIFETFNAYCVKYSTSKNITKNFGDKFEVVKCIYDPLSLNLTCKCELNTFNTLYLKESNASQPVDVGKMQNLIPTSNRLVTNVTIFISSASLLIFLVAVLVLFIAYMKPKDDTNH